MNQVIKKLPVSKLNIEQVMTADVWCLTSEMTVRKAIDLFIRKQISGAPLVHHATKILLSVVSEADLIKFAAMDGLDEPLMFFMDRLPGLSDLITAKPKEAFAELFKKFLLNPVRRVIVINEQEQVVGLVSRRDVMKAFLINE